MSDLTYREAADYLNVSPATIRNWTRQGLLPAGPDALIPRRSVRSVRNDIAGGKSPRLKKRANKKSAGGTFFPEEYALSVVEKSFLPAISALDDRKAIDPAKVVYCYFLNRIHKLKSRNINRIKKEMELWFIELGSPDTKDLQKSLSTLSLPDHPDIAGLIYQTLQREGRKSERGSYYTPPALAGEILSYYRGQWKTFLDPCCGSGIFLISAARQSGSPINITGWDTDRTAIHIARLNLMLQFPDMDFEPAIAVRNTLSDKPFPQKFDLIASNPPWGHHFRKKEIKKLKERFPEIRSGESFSFFLKAALPHLRKNGALSFLLPEAFLNVKAHRDIRKDLIEHYAICRSVFLGKIFSKVQTPVILLEVKKKSDRPGTLVQRDNHFYRVDSTRFSRNPDCIYDLNMTGRDIEIFERIFSYPHTNLEGKALWTLGVVSGNNKRFISSTPSEGYYPIICGKDIQAFSIKAPEKYLYFDRKILQQCAPLSQYRKNPKIVYRFITGKPVFALDRSGYVTLNSANSFYPETGLDPEIITLLFNSALYRYILKKKFNSIKILRSHLEYLPVPHMEKSERRILKELALKAEKQSDETGSVILEIENRVFNLFKINHSDSTYIREFDL
ncbi:N-6 DNA methylase [Spirochaeta isovalerica]|uniref:site-specific DNA-methyltransferase (adenine-specific) n=1 Tax=Spirochaeta isovalerica TaxID=150 RepID=A0A841R5Q2_9SPIO|nr:N-6 DNA methylase [Spirochaeta isovalerica]MBB6478390.1 SAM-dependent methyltransferase [Spirochaeta isovalerica]